MLKVFSIYKMCQVVWSSFVKKKHLNIYTVLVAVLCLLFLLYFEFITLLITTRPKIIHLVKKIMKRVLLLSNPRKIPNLYLSIFHLNHHSWILSSKVNKLFHNVSEKRDVNNVWKKIEVENSIHNYSFANFHKLLFYKNRFQYVF